MARTGSRGGSVENRFPDVVGTKQVDATDQSQYTTQKGGKSAPPPKK